GVSLPLAFDCCGMKVSCPPQQADQGPGCLSSQGVLQSDGLKISAQISNVSGVQLHKPHDAWPQGVSLPLAFDCCGMKVSCPPQQADLGPAVRCRNAWPGAFLQEPPRKPCQGDGAPCRVGRTSS
ncbi:hypothetical protein THAOC_15360, partial [Thalassiosira oceanica]